MAAKTVLFARRYRAALLDYLLGSSETGLARAYDLGRSAVDEGMGPLQILQAHQKATNAVLESARSVSEGLRRLAEAESFLMEALSPFEITRRGYVALLESDRDPRDQAHDGRGTRRHGRRSTP